MLEKSFGLLFYLKKPRNYQKGNMPIYLRITVDGVSKEISTGRQWDPSKWNAHVQRAAGTKEESKALNVYLDTLQAKVYEDHHRKTCGSGYNPNPLYETVLLFGRRHRQLL